MIFEPIYKGYFRAILRPELGSIFKTKTTPFGVVLKRSTNVLSNAPAHGASRLSSPSGRELFVLNLHWMAQTLEKRNPECA